MKGVVLGIAAIAAAGIAMAEEPGDTVTLEPDGRVTIASVVMAPNPCYTAGESRVGTPEGTVPIEGALSIVQPLEHNGARVCAMVITAVRFTITAELPAGAKTIVIYAVNEKTGGVHARAVGIPGR